MSKKLTNKQILIKVSASLFWVAVAYGVGAFCAMSANPIDWSVWGRLAFGIWVVLVILRFLTVMTEKSTEEKIAEKLSELKGGTPSKWAQRMEEMQARNAERFTKP